MFEIQKIPLYSNPYSNGVLTIGQILPEVAVPWFSPNELKEAVTVSNNNPGLRMGKGPQDPNLLFVPPRGAIANFIISTWLKNYHNL